MIKLYKGDNKDVIQKLNTKYNIIYLDPPYNTKNNSLLYSDNRGRSESWRIYFLSIVENTKKVIDKNAVIYTSIGHEELASVKFVMDKVFGKSNFLSIMPRITNNVAKTTKTISRINDFIVIYKVGNISFNGTEIDFSSYKLEDKHVATRGNYQLRRVDYKDFKYSKTLDFEVNFKNELFYPSDKSSWKKRRKGVTKHKDWCWIWSSKMINFAIENDFIESKNRKLFKKTYTHARITRNNGEYSVKVAEQKKPFNSLEYTDKKYGNIRSKNDIEKLFLYPKSENLIEHLFMLPKFRRKRVLDPFAGTGVSGVIADRMNIDCDLIQISEKIGIESAAYAAGYKDIFDLTKDNLKKRKIEVETYDE